MPRQTRSAKGLPDIPDHPTSPLPAWKHYYILRELESRFQKELAKKKYDGHLVGLNVTYTVGKDPYSMSYGYGVAGDQGLLAEKDDPLSDEFVAEMYDLAIDLIDANISPYIEHYQLRLGAGVNPEVGSVEVDCRIANEANCGREACNGECRKFIRRNGGPWKCTHKKGKCNCS